MVFDVPAISSDAEGKLLAFCFRLRMQKYRPPINRPRAATAPTAIPAISPPEIPGFGFGLGGGGGGGGGGIFVLFGAD